MACALAQSFAVGGHGDQGFGLRHLPRTCGSSSSRRFVGRPQRDGKRPPGIREQHGRILSPFGSPPLTRWPRILPPAARVADRPTAPPPRSPYWELRAALRLTSTRNWSSPGSGETGSVADRRRSPRASLPARCCDPTLRFSYLPGCIANRISDVRSAAKSRATRSNFVPSSRSGA
jgi:hypothetical protein